MENETTKTTDTAEMGPVAGVAIDNIAFGLLRKQKRALLSITDPEKAKYLTQEEVDAVEGMICLCDAIQDYAVDVLGMDKYQILDLTKDENEN